MTGHRPTSSATYPPSVAVLQDAQLAYATYGTLNAAADNAVLLPTFYTGTHLRNEALFGPGRAIDPARHFVVSVNLFGNGYSSSPSIAPSPQDGPRFPHVTLFDNVACQHRLLTEHLGVRGIALILGWSMARCKPINGRRNIRTWSRRSFPIAAPPAAPRSTTLFSTARRLRCRPMPPGTTATIRFRRKRACALSAASTPPGPIRTPSFATASIGSLASPRSKISCATGRRII